MVVVRSSIVNGCGGAAIEVEEEVVIIHPPTWDGELCLNRWAKLRPLKPGNNRILNTKYRLKLTRGLGGGSGEKMLSLPKDIKSKLESIPK
ncbi:hypothetical protein QJS10_CPB17g01526 [Acorus calamus]|uniref:Uncharacterized protein n=1 Tax=Acorus calamus TaxID=4465 RepID=A0AAV9CVV2_ACOCL|nr:hypothetical protein QJS10_CPB17g01526 [Acorus calamus]